MDHRNENYNMFDLIAYRIKFTPHPHAGRAWCALMPISVLGAGRNPKP